MVRELVWPLHEHMREPEQLCNKVEQVVVGAKNVLS